MLSLGELEGDRELRRSISRDWRSNRLVHLEAQRRDEKPDAVDNRQREADRRAAEQQAAEREVRQRQCATKISSQLCYLQVDCNPT